MMRLLAFCVLALVSSSTIAANWFVRPSGGTGSGTSWTAAWNGLNGISWASVACGDTIWVAGGTYSQPLAPNKNCTSSNRLNIRRARSDASAATSAAGWSAGFDSQVLIGNAGEITFNSNFSGILISGRTTAAGVGCGATTTYPAAPDTSGCGIRLSRTATTSGCGICVNGASQDNIIEYVDAQGPGEITYSADGRAIDLTPSSGTATGYTFSHMVIRDWESAIYAVSCASPTFEYIDMSNIAPTNTATLHPNGIITWGCANGIVRYNTFHRGTNTSIDIGEGVFFEQAGGSTAWQIYGNVWYDISGTRKAIEISSNVGAIKIFNNTFHGISLGTIYFSDSPSCASGEYRNNLAYSASHNTSQGACSLAASNNVTCASTACWVDAANRNYRITAATGANLPRNAGSSAPSGYFTTDRVGTTFGGDGTWDVGAYEYTTGTPDTTPPSTPTSPSATAVSAAQINLSWTASTDDIGIAGYNIERCQGSGCSSWAEVQVTSGTGTTWSDTGRAASTLYRYRIRARDAAPLYSGYSSIVEATTSAPAQVTVTPSEVIGPSYGSITPSTPQSITEGTTTTFTVTPIAQYQAFVEGTCGGSLVGTTYTTAVIAAACTVEANFIPSVCELMPAAGTADNTAMTTQTGTFTYLFSTIPDVVTHDIVFGHTNGAWAAYTSYATGVRFSSAGIVDVRNGAAYAADVVYPYSANVRYNVRMVVNISNHTYSAFVAPDGGAETQIANNYAFRTDQASVTQLNNFAYIGSVGSPIGAWVCPTGLSGEDTTAPTVQARRVVASGNSFELDLDEPAGSVSGSAGLTLTASGGAVTLAGCSTASDIISCSTSRQILGAETVTASYSGAGGIADTTGNPLASFSTQAVTNNSTQTLVALSLLTPPDGTQYRKEVTSTTVGLTTSKSASCRRASSTGVVWASMTPYTTTGATSHSSSFPMVAGGGYRVCSRCLDTAAQQYSTDACTHFSVRSARKR